jgi:hypothetical protein
MFRRIQAWAASGEGYGPRTVRSDGGLPFDVNTAVREHFLGAYNTRTEGRRPTQAQGRLWPIRHDQAVRPEVGCPTKAGGVPGYFELGDVAMEVHEVACEAWAVNERLELATYTPVRVLHCSKAEVGWQLRLCRHRHSISQHQRRNHGGAATGHPRASLSGNRQEDTMSATIKVSAMKIASRSICRPSTTYQSLAGPGVQQ